jgi:hypothetical protein
MKRMNVVAGGAFVSLELLIGLASRSKVPTRSHKATKRNQSKLDTKVVIVGGDSSKRLYYS